LFLGRFISSQSPSFPPNRRRASDQIADRCPKHYEKARITSLSLARPSGPRRTIKGCYYMDANSFLKPSALFCLSYGTPRFASASPPAAAGIPLRLPVGIRPVAAMRSAFGVMRSAVRGHAVARRWSCGRRRAVVMRLRSAVVMRVGRRRLVHRSVVRRCLRPRRSFVRLSARWGSWSAGHSQLVCTLMHVHFDGVLPVANSRIFRNDPLDERLKHGPGLEAREDRTAFTEMTPQDYHQPPPSSFFLRLLPYWYRGGYYSSINGYSYDYYY